MSPLNLNVEPYSKLWAKVRSACEVPLIDNNDYKNRRDHISQLLEKIERGTYQFKQPLGFVSSRKSNGVPRFVPVFNIFDLTVFYACSLALFERLSKLSSPNTFGGWTMGGPQREKEQEIASRLISDGSVFMDELMLDEDALAAMEYFPTSILDRAALLEDWNRFWKLAESIQSDADKDSIYLQLDIANFYDSVPINPLICKLRTTCTDDDEAISLLQKLLYYWNCTSDSNEPNSKGIPQEIIGDCSRLLASFYLIEFDHEFREFCRSRGCFFLRWSDDMIVRCPSRIVAKEILYYAGQLLNDQGLSINAHKVCILELKEYRRYWGFGIMTALESKDSEKALKLLRSAMQDGMFGKSHTILKRSISSIAGKTDLRNWKDWLHGTMVENESYLLSLNHIQMDRLAKLNPDYVEGFKQIADTVVREPFTHPKVHLVKVISKNYKTTIIELSRFHTTVLKSLISQENPIVNRSINNLSLGM